MRRHWSILGRADTGRVTGTIKQYPYKLVSLQLEPWEVVEAWRRSVPMSVSRASVDSLVDLEWSQESRVLVLYTGGTIGMMRNDRGRKCRLFCLRPYPETLLSHHD
ncbi:hypothetical protein E2C01_033113 [Portunus trituberculatus]|uniref:Asparaginase n=1 Tax=Portunus trituberculatus TaxID=210409 RepID=A0A5B7EZA3_PORTR|nr:hypothetical protein [Portunus trituberculatus]